MRRYFTAGIISALALAAGTAQAQITIVQPVIGNEEFGGQFTRVTLDVAAAAAGTYDVVVSGPYRSYAIDITYLG